MYSELRNSDAFILQKLLNYANEAYLKESRITKRSTFGIIRILGAHKILCHQYPLRQGEIYNWIMFISKHFNPKTVKQWQSAIQDLSSSNEKQKMSRTHNEYKLDLPKQTHMPSLGSQISNIFSINENSTRVRESRSYNNLKNFSHKQFQYYEEHEGKYVNSVNGLPVSSKIHYISFQPTENKENMNSDNFRESKAEVQPTRTPGQQSFIQNLQSSHSPFITSKITYNTKDITEVAEQNEQWQIMKQRADIFFTINSKFRAFTSLLANFQAYESYKQMRNKAVSGVKKIKFYQFLSCCQQNIDAIRLKKRSKKKAQIYHEGVVKKKVFNIFKILLQLKISPKKQAKIERYNCINFEFLIELMFFMPKSENETPRSSKDLREIPNKFTYFKDKRSYDKLQTIILNFTNNLKVTKEQIEHIFELRDKSILMKCFKGLKKVTNTHEKQKQKLKKYKKEVNGLQLIKILSKKREQKKIVQYCTKIRNTKLQGKYFKVLNELALSKKMYHKRLQYIYFKNIESRQKVFMGIWRKALSERLMEKKTYNEKVETGGNKIRNGLIRWSFKRIKQMYNKDKKYEIQANSFKEKQLMKKILDTLKERVEHKKIFSIIREKSTRRSKNRIIGLWKKRSNMMRSIAKMMKVVSVSMMDQAMNTLEYNNSEYILEKIRNVNEKHRFIKQFRICHKLDQQQQIQKVDNVVKYSTNMKVCVLYDRMKSMIRQKRRKEEDQENQVKSETIKHNINSNGKLKFIKYLRSMKDEREQENNKILTIHNSLVIKNRVQFMKMMKQHKQGNDKVQQVIRNRCMHYTKQLIKRIRNVIKVRKSQSMRKQVHKRMMMKAIYILKQENKMSKVKAILGKQKYKHNIKHKLFKRLVQCVEGTKDKINRLNQKCIIRKKTTSIKDFVDIIHHQQDNKGKYNILASKIFMKRLKSNKTMKEQMKNKDNKLKKYMKCGFIQKLKEYSSVPELINTYQNYDDLGMKMIWFNRFTSGITKQILNNKMKYMALKLRAMHLMKQGFSGILTELKANNKFKIQRIPPNYEHFSTQYSSI